MNSLQKAVPYICGPDFIKLAITPRDKLKPCWVNQSVCAEGLCCRCEIASELYRLALSQSETENALN